MHVRRSRRRRLLAWAGRRTFSSVTHFLKANFDIGDFFVQLRDFERKIVMRQVKGWESAMWKPWVCLTFDPGDHQQDQQQQHQDAIEDVNHGPPHACEHGRTVSHSSSQHWRLLTRNGFMGFMSYLFVESLWPLRGKNRCQTTQTGDTGVPFLPTVRKTRLTGLLSSTIHFQTVREQWHMRGQLNRSCLFSS